MFKTRVFERFMRLFRLNFIFFNSFAKRFLH
jgi:hypothetical protein